MDTPAPSSAGPAPAPTVLAIRARPARQQPRWEDLPLVRRTSRELAARPALVRAPDLWTLRSLLARVADGEAQVVQAGDCAEDPEECGKGSIARKAGLLDMLAGLVRMSTHRPVLRVGRIAGQFAKPRSNDTERAGDRELPVFRGHVINGPEPDADSRRPDPRRMLHCYDAAAEAMQHLGWGPGPTRPPVFGPQIWTSHEALLLDYELPQLRRDEEGGLMLASTHWPWIGKRTNDPEGAHAALLAAVINPVACKVDAGMSRDHLLRMCEVLDPRREKGRLTLIARMGADAVADRLPPLVAAVRAAGHPVVWLCDPMHGNTVTTEAGLKTRYVEVVTQEVRHFQCAVRSSGGVVGGLHLEITPDEVTECAANAAEAGRVGDKYTSLCDPRLNPGQAAAVVGAWLG
ncbi:3-deoxy-7-phosphoheptulonate synthase [Streptomyces aidingensis]|uniref:Phospho-2-dehydro-3-deoxyheptonate aldolase n=1 Tax=Streptomyces aidingensis TaxID=910347 RepID=A0A1I1FH00_9ACTN|nr:3-deoxy-7-phosphoheptulonate synthase [Streptomyces aidingensis]SFB98216.1 3-deoxy-D-arabinoheptulosonate-7-phosphate synthase [Streptomyces aidingensis]